MGRDLGRKGPARGQRRSGDRPDRSATPESCHGSDPRLAATFPEHQILGVAADGKVVARINSVPFKWTGSDEDLPDRGWDAAIEMAFSDGGARDMLAISLLEARIAPDYQGSGFSGRLLQAAIGNARRLLLRLICTHGLIALRCKKSGIRCQRLAAGSRSAR